MNDLFYSALILVTNLPLYLAVFYLYKTNQRLLQEREEVKGNIEIKIKNKDD
jgi:hypothetical protein